MTSFTPKGRHQWILFLNMILFALPLSASHIIGGSLSYECLGGKKYEIHLTVYADCYYGGSPFDNPANIGIFNEQDSLIRQIDLYNPTIQELKDSCLTIPDDLCVEAGTYQKTITFSDTPSNYALAYQRCCRNSTNKNVYRPDSTGMTAFAHIPDTNDVKCNSSPQFNQFPPIAQCTQNDLTVNSSASDKDGDSLVYSFCTPYDGASPTWPKPNKPAPPPYDKINWASGYSTTDPIKAQPPLSINPETGEVTGSPEDTGRFIVGVCAKEYRNGVYLGETRRIIQINLLNCDSILEAQVPDNHIKQCGQLNVSFQNSSQGADSYFWDFGDTTITQDTSTQYEPNYRYSDTGTYQVLLEARTFEGCKDTTHLNVDLYPGITADYNYTTTCQEDSIPFTNLSTADSSSIQSWNWSFGDGDTSSLKNPTHYYSTPNKYKVQLVIEDNNKCRDTMTNSISYFPRATINYSIGPEEGCTPYPLNLYDSSKATNDYTIQWKSKDSVTKEGKKVQYVYENDGVYSVTLRISSPTGCVTSDTFKDVVTIRQSPVANFTPQPDTTTILKPEVKFYNSSEGGVQWYWDFNSEDTAHNISPTYEFQRSGTKQVMLVVTHPSGCKDTMVKNVFIKPITKLFFPNAFSPNNNNLNDRFYPLGLTHRIATYEIQVWNRWGELVYTSTNINEGWNGKVGNDGPDCAQGLYYYIVKLVDIDGRPKRWQGYVTLVR